MREAARLLYLLAGVSYYKTRVPQVVTLGDVPASEEDRKFLRDFYVHGLGEFAYRQREHDPATYPDGLDLSQLQLVGGVLPTRPGGRPRGMGGNRPLIPFGGGLDSIVTVAMLRGRVDDSALFIVNRPDDHFLAIEAPAARTGLPIVRAERSIDPKLLRSSTHGYLNGHVPVTGIISAMGVVAAALLGYDAVIMSNEWSASSATLTLADGRTVNHQYSKSAEFEFSFAARLRERGLPDCFSLLRPFTELWIADYFSRNCGEYLTTFRSCNRAFTIDRERRLDHWCGTCDKCAFIDLILAPFVSPGSLADVFRGDEPLMNPELAPVFERLLGLGHEPKPWECVGDVVESRVAMRLARMRPGGVVPFIESIAARAAAMFNDPETGQLLRPISTTGIPERYERLLGLA